VNEVINLWPIISGVLVVGALAIAFRAEVLVKIEVLQEKVKTLFEMVNNLNKRK